MKFDDILLSIGEFGPYQKRIYFLLCLSPFLCGAQVFSAVFVYNTPSFRCHIPGYADDAYTIRNPAHAQAVKLSVPPGRHDDEGEYSNCQLYADFNDSSFLHGDEDGGRPSGNATESCDAWVYDRSEVEESVVTEFNLVCDKAILKSHSLMIIFAGALIGAITTGVIADVFGRKLTILLALVTQFATGLGAYFAPSFYFLIGVRALNGVALHALFAICATTGIELVGPDKRALTGIGVEYFWVAGELMMAPVAYLVRDWRDLQLLLGLASVPIFVAAFFFMPESPRWLIDKERFGEAEAILEKICASNNTKLSANALGKDTVDEDPQMAIWKIFKYKTLVIRFLLIILCWFSVNIIYYGLTINTGNLAGSLFVNYLVSGVAEGVAYIISLPLLARFGRRTVFAFSMFVTCAACVAAVVAILLHAPNWVVITMNMVGKLGGSCCYAVLYVLSAEIFPTIVRNSAMGLCSVFENVGGMLSPYAIDMGVLVDGAAGPALTMIVFSCLSLLAGIACLLLPETRNQTIPETIQDAIDFNKPRKTEVLELE